MEQKPACEGEVVKSGGAEHRGVNALALQIHWLRPIAECRRCLADWAHVQQHPLGLNAVERRW
ncbi:MULTISPECIES: hypothetical protein [Streptomyces]|uniref:Uncharacterized protein n=1 Tax=Streptomyces siderophoricus TaxID=2802281 RepID=A0ABS1MSJ8_9ACTN|nr:hypothetical protein [Streptomyces sp. 9-7]MBL1090723.1 hypothetical protein [Streptomyces sp. 9-7]